MYIQKIRKRMKKHIAKKGRGGWRGGGRPKGSTIAHDIKRIILTGVRLPQWIVDWIKSQEKSGGRVIEEALVEHYRLSPSASNTVSDPKKKRNRG
jgi:hypothetical protein